MTPIEQVLIALRRVMRATGQHSRYLARTTGLTTPQILVLQAVRDAQSLIVSELAARVNLSQATVTSILDRLEKRHLVSRERALQDKRKVVISLTGAGEKMLENAPIPLQEQFTKQFHDLQPWEQHMIVASLQRVALMMDADGIDASPVLDVGLLVDSESSTDMNKPGR